ncbi:MAG: hypothetical protein LBK62_01200 [Treponema sp.]|jgi:hypothetical protein|nr:hypothetical protein [Treponema sp.]
MVYLAKKAGRVPAHTDLQAMYELDGVDTPELTVTDAEFEAAEGLARIIEGEIFLGKTEAEQAAEEAAAEIRRIKTEIAARDYRALKAQKLGEEIDDLYPGGTDWYKEQLDRMEELEAIVAGVGN